jgi:hypothetical protein
MVIFGGDYQPTRLFVEAVHDSWPFYAADAGKAISAMREKRIYQRAAAIPRSRVNNKPGGFIDYNQIIILVNDIEWDGFWLR